MSGVWSVRFGKANCLLMFCSALYMCVDMATANNQKICTRLDELQNCNLEGQLIDLSKNAAWLAIVKLNTGLQHPNWNWVSKCVKIESLHQVYQVFKWPLSFLESFFFFPFSFSFLLSFSFFPFFSFFLFSLLFESSFVTSFLSFRALGNSLAISMLSKDAVEPCGTSRNRWKSPMEFHSFTPKRASLLLQPSFWPPLGAEAHGTRKKLKLKWDHILTYSNNGRKKRETSLFRNKNSYRGSVKKQQRA